MGPRHDPLGVGGSEWAVSAHPDFGSKTFKADPWAGPYGGRSEATNPVPLEYELSREPMQLGFPGFPGIVAPQGRHVGSGWQNWQHQPSRVANQGWLSRQSRCAKP